MNKIFARAAVAAAIAVGSAGAFYAGIAYAADPKFDQAIDNCTKAIALLQAATNAGAAKDTFEGHRHKAIADLQDAIDQINLAKKVDDKTPPPATTTAPAGSGSAKPPGSGKPSAGK